MYVHAYVWVCTLQYSTHRGQERVVDPQFGLQVVESLQVPPGYQTLVIYKSSKCS